jgi:hypothetical protein
MRRRVDGRELQIKVLHIHSTALIVHFRPGVVPNVIMTWLRGVRALGCSRDVAENLRNPF